MVDSTGAEPPLLSPEDPSDGLVSRDRASRDPASRDPASRDLATRPARSWRPSPLMAASIAWHGVILGAAARDLACGVPKAGRRAARRLLADHLLLSAAGILPRSQGLGPALVRLEGVDDAVALTFDDGPDPVSTPRVLDRLDAHGARASFFCVGRRVLDHPETAREIVRRGHLVENHSHLHRHSFSFQVWWPLRREIALAQAAIHDTVGRAPAWFRAPAGIRNPFLEPVLASLGLDYAAWTRRGFDAVDPSPQRVLRRLERGLAAGDVLLLHDAHGARDRHGRPVVDEVLPRLLDRLAERGLRAVPLPADGLSAPGTSVDLHAR